MKPLEGRSILITRSRRQASEFRRILESRGARIFEIPTIEIRPRREPALDAAIRRLNSYDWLIFTSPNGVDLFFQRAEEIGEKTVEAKGPRIAAIGPATAERIRAAGHRVDLLPDLYQAEGLLEEFQRRYPEGMSGQRVLLPRASSARQILPQQLQARGAELQVIPVYDTVIPGESRQKLEEILSQHRPDLITFTSSSTVHHFVELAPDPSRLQRFSYAAIGPITAATAEQYGLKVVCRASESTIPALAEAIDDYFRDEI